MRSEASKMRIVMKNNITYKVGRDSKTGRFIPVKVAEKRKSTATVETIKKPIKD
jgi:hypothetical protein